MTEIIETETIEIRLDILIGFLNHLFAPTPLLLSSNCLNSDYLDIADDNNSAVMNYLIYSLKSGSVVEISQGWRPYLLSFVNKDTIYRQFVEENPQIVGMIPVEKWFIFKKDPPSGEGLKNPKRKRDLLPPFEKTQPKDIQLQHMEGPVVNSDFTELDYAEEQELIELVRERTGFSGRY